MEPNVQKLIDQAKADGHKVFKLRVAGVDYVYRTLNRAEYMVLQKSVADKVNSEVDLKADEDSGLTDEQKQAKAREIMNQVEAISEEALVTACVLSPDMKSGGFNGLPAGVTSTLSASIMEACGFNIQGEVEEL